MIRRPPRSTQSRSSAASDVYKRQIQKVLQLADDDVDGDQVEASFGNDEVRISLGRLHKLQVHRPDDIHVLRHHGLDRAAPLARVSQQSADEPDIGVCVDVELDVQQITQGRVLQHKDTLEDDDRLRLDVVGPGLTLIAGVAVNLSLIHISEPTRLGMISYAV